MTTPTQGPDGQPSWATPPPQKRKKWTWVVGVLAVLAVLVVIGTVAGGNDETATSTDTATSPQQTATPEQSPPATTAPQATVEPSDCRPTVPFSGTDDPSIQATAESVTLPAGTSIVTGRISTDSDYPGEFAIAIDLCGAAVTSADDLRPIATEFAKAYKGSPAADQIFALYVANYESYTTTGTSGEVKVKDPDFQLNLWNGKPSEQAEQQRWEVVTE